MQTVNSLTDLSGAPYVITIGETDYPLCRLQPGDMAAAHAHVISKRLTMYAQTTRAFNYPPEVHALSNAAILSHTMTLQELWNDWDAVTFMLHASCARGGMKLPLSTFRDALQPLAYGWLRDVLALISGWITSEQLKDLAAELDARTKGEDNADRPFDTILPTT